MQDTSGTNMDPLWTNVKAVFGLAVGPSQGGLGETEFMFNLNIGSPGLRTVTAPRKKKTSHSDRLNRRARWQVYYAAS